MTAQLTAVVRKVPEGYIGWVEEIPGANVQKASLEEARHSLAEAVQLVLEANRDLAQLHHPRDGRLFGRRV
jgi:predicted RNase H-like HicB family nuclease